VTQDALAPRFDSLQRSALMVGAIGLVLCLVGLVASSEQFFQAYLYAYLFWLGLTLGSLFMLMLQHLTGGSWGAMIQRPLEAAVTLMPLLALLFVPLLFGLTTLYPWTDPAFLARYVLVEAKTAYLNIPFFVARAVVYFAVWIGLAMLFVNLSRRQDFLGDQGFSLRMRNAGAAGLILLLLSVTFATFDWGMSLEPKWFSGIYGLLFMSGQAISSMALVIAVVVLLAHVKPLSAMVNKKRLQDLGNLLLVFVMFWAYVNVSQLIIIWSGNLVETNPWYVLRLNEAWAPLALFLVVFHFAIPFVILFSRWVKSQGRALLWIAAWLIVMRLFDLFWVIVPAFGREGFQLHWLDLAAITGLGGLWLAGYINRLKRHPLLPLNDPRVLKAVEHG